MAPLIVFRVALGAGPHGRGGAVGLRGGHGAEAAEPRPELVQRQTAGGETVWIRGVIDRVRRRRVCADRLGVPPRS
jgi:hypothetical protein